jgi:hypothetical protein
MYGYWNGTTFEPGGADVKQVAGTAQTARDLGASVLISSGTGAGQLSVSSGKVAATIASGDAVGLPAAAAGAKGGIPITDPSTGLILTGYGGGTVKNDLIDAPNSTALTAVGTAVWAATSRTLSSFGTLVADIATAVWGAVARTITGTVTLDATQGSYAPAKAGDKMDLIDSPNAKAVCHIKAGPPTVVAAGDGKSYAFKDGAGNTICTIATTDGYTWTVT